MFRDFSFRLHCFCSPTVFAPDSSLVTPVSFLGSSVVNLCAGGSTLFCLPIVVLIDFFP